MSDYPQANVVYKLRDPRMWHPPWGELHARIGQDVYILRGDTDYDVPGQLRYEGPYKLAKITKAGHAMVLSDQPVVESRRWPMHYANHRCGDKYRSTFLAYRVAILRGEDEPNQT